jgi:hypothetical protein
MSSDFALDLDGDLDLSSGDLYVLEETYTQVVAQRIRLALLTKTGEYFKDIDVGIPYFTQFFIVKSNKAYIDQYFTDYLERIEDVSAITHYSSVFDPLTRVLNVEFNVTTLRGDTIPITINDDTIQLRI